MRRKKHRNERLAACGDMIIKQLAFDGCYLEIGCGKGDFICELAKRNPQKRYTAIEKNPDVAVLAVEKAKRNGLQNVQFAVGDAVTFLEEATGNDCAGIFINFCDPWHKEGYRKRRLTHPVFLERYRAILSPGAEIHFKTDNRKLFQFSLNSFLENRYALKNISLDLHHDHNPENIMTEYEKQFSELGYPIFRLEAKPL